MKGYFCLKAFANGARVSGLDEASTRRAPSFLAFAKISSRLVSKMYPFASASRLAFATAGFAEAASASLPNNNHAVTMRWKIKRPEQTRFISRLGLIAFTDYLHSMEPSSCTSTSNLRHG